MSSYTSTHTGSQIDTAITEIRRAGNKVVARLFGVGAPTNETVGAVGDLYIDTTGGKLYCCISAAEGIYTWDDVGADAVDAAAALVAAHNTDDDAHTEIMESVTHDMRLIESQNLHDFTGDLADKAINQYGTIYDNDGTTLTGYISVIEGKVLKYYDNYLNAREMTKVAYFNSDKSIMGLTGQTSAFEIPNDCKYVRIMVLTEYYSNNIMFAYETPTKYEPYYKPYYALNLDETNDKIDVISATLDETNDKIDVIKSYRTINNPINVLVSSTMMHDKAINQYGTVYDNDGTSVSDFIAVKSGEKYKYYDSYRNPAAVSKTVFFNATKHAVKEENNIDEIVIGENCEYIRIMILKAYWTDKNMLCTTQPLVYSEYHKPYLSDFPYVQRFIYMPRIFLTGSFNGMSKSNSCTLAFNYKGAENYAYTVTENGVQYSGYAEMKWQGTSSQAYEKKNYSLKLYENESKTTPLNVEFKSGWGSHNKYVLKANHIDATHARNICCAKLWGNVVKSRNSSNPLMSRLTSLVNGGAIDGYPVILFLNDEYLGLYTLNIPKDAYMFSMDGSDKEAILCCESHNDESRFIEPSACDGTDWTIEYQSSIFTTNELISSFNEIQAACALTGDAFKAAIEPVCDVDSVIDYIIYLLMFDMSDNYDKNMIMATFDGSYWFTSMYDMDTTFGNNWDGTAVTNAAANLNISSSYIYNNRLLRRVHENYTDEFNARLSEISNEVLSAENVAYVLNNFVTKIPAPIYNQEAMMYPSIPNTSIKASDIITYYKIRKELIDKILNN